MNKEMSSDLGALADPQCYLEKLALHDWSATTLKTLLKKMLLIRIIEEEIAELAKTGLTKTPCHLSIGQEAIPVGISASLNSKDKVFSAHRAHGHYLALDADPYALIAEVLGRVEGCSRGMGGSMHIVAMEQGFYGSVPIVAGTIPLAVGAALAIKLKEEPQVAVSYFGDGACEEGVLHESLNLASIMNLPCVFVCENNLYSSHLDIHLRQPSDSVARFAKAHCMRFEVLDGNDVIAVAQAAKDLIGYAREKSKPVFIEAVTYRWRGHVGPNEDIDVGVRRSQSELIAWKKRDPIRRLSEAMIDRGDLSAEELLSLSAEIKQQTVDWRQRALAGAYPETTALLDLVYGD